MNKTIMKSLTTVNDIHMALSALIPNEINNEDVTYVCVGTDRSTGDSLGPLVGTFLKSLGYQNVFGTIEEPVHALNLEETIYILPKDKKIIAFDATLGQITSVETVQVSVGSIKPGAGVNKELPEVGDFSVNGIVNVGGFMEYFVLQNTRLSLVMKMARDIVAAISMRFPLESKKEENEKVETEHENSYQRFETGLLV